MIYKDDGPGSIKPKLQGKNIKTLMVNMEVINNPPPPGGNVSTKVNSCTLNVWVIKSDP